MTLAQVVINLERTLSDSEKDKRRSIHTPAQPKIGNEGGTSKPVELVPRRRSGSELIGTIGV